MSGLILDTRDQPGLEVPPPVHKVELGYHQHETKDAVGTSTPRIYVLSARMFWIAFALVLVVLGAAIGGGVGGGLSAAHKDKNAPQEQSTSPASSLATSTSSLTSISSLTATSSSASTFSVTSTSSAITPFSTQPGIYRIINILANTAMDLFLGGTTNDTEIEGWQWDPTTVPGAHQTWQIASVGNGAIVIWSTLTNSYITAPSDLTAGIDPINESNAQVYGGVPGSSTDAHTQWVIVPNSDNSIGFSSKAYPSKLLNLEDGNPASGTPILLWEKNGGLNQEWRLVS